MKAKLLIVIDGPCAAGKTIVSKLIAEKLNYNYLDTGALYRGLAYKLSTYNISTIKIENIRNIVDNTNLYFGKNKDEQLRLFLDHKDITNNIRTSEISMLASKISSIGLVRNFLLKKQREIGKNKGLIAEGRDMGTVVFPDADFKFFLTADIKQRAIRRFKQYGLNNKKTLSQIESEITIRDKQDITRDIAPLKAACDSIRLDSTNLKLSKVVEFVINKIIGC